MPTSTTASNIACRPLTTGDDQQVAEFGGVVVLAFHDNPVRRFLVRSLPPDQTLAAAEWIYAARSRIFQARSSQARIIVAQDTADGRVVGGLALTAPDFEISSLDMMRQGIIGYTFRHGLDAFRDIIELSKVFHQVKDNSMSLIPNMRGPCYLLEQMAVHPSQQGRRVGSELLQAAMQLLQDEPIGPKTCLLFTQKECNVEFYQKRGGFQVVWKGEVLGFPCWSMAKVIE